MNRINKAFLTVSREDFVPEELQDQALFNVPLPIGFGQTNSQPSTVQSMLEWLEPQTGDLVLDVGSGSGWTSALLAYIVGLKGTVISVEKIPELLQMGEDNCRAIGAKNIYFFLAGDEYGKPERGPYDRILVSASAQTLPETLLSQLKVGGKLVMPVQNEIVEVTKLTHEDYDVLAHPGYVFVPLV